MDIFTIDFETFYGDDFTLSKLTTEAYIRDPRFEPILCGIKRNAEPAYWVDAPSIRSHLEKLELHKHAVLAHHAHFDGLILSHHYGIAPKVWFDTLAMARALHGANGGLSLAKLAERYDIGAKGTEVINAKGKRRNDFNTHDLYRYGAYCEQDCNLEYRLFNAMVGQFDKGELQLIDLMTRMFAEPVLDIDAELLTEYIATIKSEKLALLLEAGIQIADVMSNDKFAAALQQVGVVPPTKISLTTGKEAWAFAKTDPAMEALAEHPDEVVQTLIAARLKNKTTINETRAQRMVDMIGRGPAPVYLKYYGASTTGRASGGDKCLVGTTTITVLRAGAVLDIMLSALLNGDLVWDGVEFVTHGGLIYQGEKEVISYGGITGTPDHKVWVNSRTEPVELGFAAREGLVLRNGGAPPRVERTSQTVPSSEG